MFAALKKLEVDYAVHRTVGLLDYLMSHAILMRKIDEARQPVADKAAIVWDGSEYSREWLKAQPVDVILSACGPCVDPAHVIEIAISWPRGIFVGFDLASSHADRQEIADKAEFLWRTQQGDKSYVMASLVSGVDQVRSAYAVRLDNVTACADAALRLYHSGWPIHAFDGLKRAQVIGHAAKLNRGIKSYVWGYRYRANAGVYRLRPSLKVFEVANLPVTGEHGKPSCAELFTAARLRQPDAYDIVAVFCEEVQ